jgi:hypothetical protein
MVNNDFLKLKNDENVGNGYLKQQLIVCYTTKQQPCLKKQFILKKQLFLKNSDLYTKTGKNQGQIQNNSFMAF